MEMQTKRMFKCEESINSFKDLELLVLQSGQKVLDVITHHVVNCDVIKYLRSTYLSREDFKTTSLKFATFE